MTPLGAESEKLQALIAALEAELAEAQARNKRLRRALDREKAIAFVLARELDGVSEPPKGGWLEWAALAAKETP